MPTYKVVDETGEWLTDRLGLADMKPWDDAIVARGLEGVVAKREKEPYQPGVRS